MTAGLLLTLEQMCVIISEMIITQKKNGGLI